jgi:hypothetical protein
MRIPLRAMVGILVVTAPLFADAARTRYVPTQDAPVKRDISKFVLGMSLDQLAPLARKQCLSRFCWAGRACNEPSSLRDLGGLGIPPDYHPVYFPLSHSGGYNFVCRFNDGHIVSSSMTPTTRKVYAVSTSLRTHMNCGDFLASVKSEFGVTGDPTFTVAKAAPGQRCDEWIWSAPGYQLRVSPDPKGGAFSIAIADPEVVKDEFVTVWNRLKGPDQVAH